MPPAPTSASSSPPPTRPAAPSSFPAGAAPSPPPAPGPLTRGEARSERVRAQPVAQQEPELHELKLGGTKVDAAADGGKLRPEPRVAAADLRFSRQPRTAV